MRRAKKRKAQCNIPMTLACVLFCLTLISIHFTGGLYARYTTSGTASDSARVVTFGNINIEETADTVTIDKKEVLVVTPGVDLKKDVEVTFSGSETDTFLFVAIEANGWSYAKESENNVFYKNVNSKRILSCTVAGGWTYLKKDGNTYVFYKYVDTNTVVNQEDVLAETYEGSGKQITVNAETTKADLEAMGNMSLTFKAIAVQAGGFENAEDAWTAVKNHG